MELCFDRDPGRIPGSPIGDGPLQWDQCDFDAVRCGPPTPRDRSNPRDNPLTPGDSPRSVPPPGNGPGHHRPGCRWGHCGRGWPDDGRFNGLSRAPRNRRGRSPPEVDLPGTPYNSSVRGVGRKDRDGLARRFPTVTTPTDELTSFDEKISIGAIGFGRRASPASFGAPAWRDQPHRHNRFCWRDRLRLAHCDRLRSAWRTPVAEDASCVRDGKHLNAG